MASGIYLNESVWSSPLVGYNKKQNRRVVDLHWKKHGQIEIYLLLLQNRSLALSQKTSDFAQLSQTQTSACEAFHNVHELINFVLSLLHVHIPMKYAGKVFSRNIFFASCYWHHNYTHRLCCTTMRIVKGDKLLLLKNKYEVLAVGKCHVVITT